CDLSLGVYPDALHRRQVDHHAVVADGIPRYAMAAALDGDHEIVVTCEVDRRDHVRDAGAAGDDRGAAVDHPVEDGACGVVARVMPLEQLAAEARSELLNRGPVDHYLRLLHTASSQWSSPRRASDSTRSSRAWQAALL